MKILLIVPLPPPITGQSLASKVFLDELIKHHQVEIVNFNKNSLENGVNSLRRIIEVLKILCLIMRKKKDVDVIYLTISESFAGNIKDLVTYLICFNSLHRMLIHLHGGSLKKVLFDQNRFIFIINKYFIRRMGGTILLGQSHIRSFADFIQYKKLHIVPNFVEDYLLLSEKEILKKFTNTNPLRILFLSNLIPGKGHHELLEAFISLNDNLKKMVQLDFAGAFESDTQKKIFLNKIEGFKQIHYHGVVYGDVKKRLLSRSHMLCLPTYLLEGQSIVILEAYASGCVVITTGQCGNSDIFTDGINGYKIQPRSADSIKLVFEQAIAKAGQLFPMAISNRKIVDEKYRTSIYNASLIRIIEGIGSKSKDQQ